MKRLLLVCLLLSVLPLLAQDQLTNQPAFTFTMPVLPDLHQAGTRISYYDVMIMFNHGKLLFHHQGEGREHVTLQQGQEDVSTAWLRVARFFQVMNELHPEDAQAQMKALGISLSIDGNVVGFKK